MRLLRHGGIVTVVGRTNVCYVGVANVGLSND
jgi:hypothetical protein